MTPKRNINLSYRILSALECGPLTARQLAERLHIVIPHVSFALRNLLDQKLIHIARYVNTPKTQRGPRSRIYGLGRGPDTPAKPQPPLTDAEKSKRWRDNGGSACQARTIRRQAARITKTASSFLAQFLIKTEK